MNIQLKRKTQKDFEILYTADFALVFFFFFGLNDFALVNRPHDVNYTGNTKQR